MTELRACPKCETVFRVTREQLLAADGALRCGSCFTIFDASSNIEEANPQVLKESEGDIRESNLHAYQQQLSNKKSRDRDGFLELDTAYLRVIENSSIAESFDLIMAPRSRAKVSRAWHWICILLILLGLSQYLYFNFERYASDPNYRIYAVQLCAFLGCQLAEFSDPESLSVGDLSIRSDPDNPNALIVNAIIQNAAVFRQRFPGIKLEFYDASSMLVAKRIFSAQEYLDGDFRSLRFIPAGTEVRFALKIIDPGELAMGYEISLMVR